MFGMADCLSRHSSPSNISNQVNAELRSNRLTVNNVRNEKSILDEQNRQRTTTQPITGEIAFESERGEVAIENHLSVCDSKE